MQSLHREEGEKRSAQMFWQRYFAFYDTLQEAIPYRQMIKRHVELLQPKAEDVILDAGTGTGNVAVALLERGAQVTGIDFCEEALVRCRQKTAEGVFLFGDLTGRLDFGDESFDKIACCNVLYTLQPKDQDNAVHNLFRVLKPGGLAVITVFGAGFRALQVYCATLRLQYQATGLLDAMRRGLRYAVNTARILYYVRRIKRWEKTGDYTFFTRAEFTALLEKAGFVVELMEPIFASQCLIALVRKPASR